MNNIHNYWSDLDERLVVLQDKGFVKLPSIKLLGIESFEEGISKEIGDDTFKEKSKTHSLFLKNLDIDTYLVPKLYKLAQDFYGYKGSQENQYHIGRKVSPGNSKEMYRSHFDSHIFTIVFPLKIPPAEGNTYDRGELIFYPKQRNMPKNELINFFGKVYYKKYASKSGLDNLSKKYKQKTETFDDYCPILFLGNTTLHTNKPVSSNLSSYRLTLLAHFFDPSPKYGVGSILRFLRGR